MPGGAAVGGEEHGNQTGTATVVGGRYPSAIAQDGSRVVLAGPVPGTSQLYVRTDALDPARAATVPVSALPCASDAIFLAATPGVGTVYFACGSPLTGDATEKGGVYAFDVATGTLRFLTPETPDDGGVYQNGSSIRVVAADPSAAHVYFSSRQKLTDDAVSGRLNLYVLAGEDVRLVAELTPATLAPLTANGQAETAPDGRLVFQTTAPLAPGYDTAGHQQVYLYDPAGDRLACVSCRPDGAAATGPASLRPEDMQEYASPNRVPAHGSVSAGSDRVFFTSHDALVPADTNGEADAYVYLDGDVRLLSSGRDAYPSVFAGASADGRDAFILTHETLVPHDVDDSVADVYVARVGGGLPAPPGPLPPCGAGDECQGPPPPAPSLPQAASVTFAGPGDVRPAARAPRAKVSAKRKVTGRSFTVKDRTPGRGRITAWGRHLRTVTKAAKKAATYRLRVALGARGRTLLARKGRLRVRPHVRFSPSSGQASSATLAVTLRGKGRR